MDEKIETIKDGKGNTVALIIYHNYHKEGTNFFTPQDSSLQLGYIYRKKGEIPKTHIHNIVKRSITVTQETLFIRKGKYKVDLYDSKKKYLDSRILKTGDVILLSGGGHGFEALENSEIIEVKQGPYINDKDKILFEGIEKNEKFHDTSK